MNKKIEVFLTEADVEKIKKEYKKIGQGNEGSIYKTGNGLLYKFYYKLTPHEREEKVHTHLKEYIEIEEEDSSMKVVKDSDKRIDREVAVTIRPYQLDLDGVKKVCLVDEVREARKYSISQIEEARRRQDNVKQTWLPLGPIYIDDKLGGVVLKQHKRYFDLHIISILPSKVRLKILKKILEALKELCDNNIYSTDFAHKEDRLYPHVNILINMLLKIQFIDLEGKSTIYTYKYDDSYNTQAYSEFYLLFLDIMFGEQFEGEKESEYDLSFFEELLRERGVNEEYIKYLKNLDNLDYDSSKKLIDNYKLYKK
jgi:hypothetical protein